MGCGGLIASAENTARSVCTRELGYGCEHCGYFLGAFYRFANLLAAKTFEHGLDFGKKLLRAAFTAVQQKGKNNKKLHKKILLHILIISLYAEI